MKDRKPIGFYSNMTDKQSEGYVRKHYFGKTLNEFHNENGTFYNELCKRKLIDECVKKGILKRKYKKFKNLDELIAEAKKVMEENNLDILPGEYTFRRLHRYDIVRGIYSFCDNYTEFRKLLGEKIKEIPDWKNKKYAIKQAKKIMQQHNLKTLPSSGKLRELGYFNLAGAIYRRYGFTNFRKLLGEKIKEIPDWKNKKYAIKQAKKIMQQHGFESLPSSNKLKELGYSGLVTAVSEYHGGFHTFRELLGEKQKERKKGLLKNLNYVIQEVRKIISKHNLKTLPSAYKLSKLSDAGLSFAIVKYHGGFPYFREILNQKLGIQSERQQLENLLDGYLKQ